ncbi:MAG TPA: transposase, partial [Phormidium sp.]
NTTFIACLFFLTEETFPNYSWALNKFKSCVVALPQVLVTDRELALMNAIDNVFPESIHLLCIWHINKNILAKTKVHFPNNQKAYDNFIASLNATWFQDSKEEFYKAWEMIATQYQSHKAFKYVQENWFQYRKRFVKAWTKEYTHFGSQVTSRVESLHSILKQYVQLSRGDLLIVVQKVLLLLVNQYNALMKELLRQQLVQQKHLHHHLFSKLHGKVSIFALKLIFDQYSKIEDDKKLPICTNVFTKTMGLPCSHQIEKLLAQNECIPIESIHTQWLLQPAESVIVEPTEHPTLELLISEFHLKFENALPHEQENLLQQMKDLIETVPLQLSDPTVAKV